MMNDGNCASCGGTYENEFEAYDSYDEGYENEFDSFFGSDGDEFEFETGYEEDYDEDALTPEEQEFLALELLGAHSDEDLEMFFGKVFKALKSKKARRFFKGAAKMLKPIVKKALPTVASIAGNAIAPGIGGAIGGMAGNAVAGALELEGVEPDQIDYEVARRLTAVTNDVISKGMKLANNLPEPVAAKKAAVTAMRRHFPQLKNVAKGANSGRWVRRNGQIVILGA